MSLMRDARHTELIRVSPVHVAETAEIQRIAECMRFDATVRPPRIRANVLANLLRTSHLRVELVRPGAD
jgi:hypothetical protein